MTRFSFGDLLSFFSANELARAASRAGLGGGGSKIEKLENLRVVALQNRASPAAVLDFFSAEALRRVSTRLGVPGTDKRGCIAALCAALTETFPPPPQQVALNLDGVSSYVRSLDGSRRDIGDEADAEWFLASALSDHFRDVRVQVSVPGHFGHRIDIDIGSGRFGVEVKLARSVIESSSEAYRLLGQAFYYDRRRYARRLLVVVVGTHPQRSHPIIGEVFDLLAALGVRGQFLSVA
jgi:hypothetical protein